MQRAAIHADTTDDGVQPKESTYAVVQQLPLVTRSGNSDGSIPSKDCAPPEGQVHYFSRC